MSTSARRLYTNCLHRYCFHGLTNHTKLKQPANATNIPQHGQSTENQQHTAPTQLYIERHCLYNPSNGRDVGRQIQKKTMTCSTAGKRQANLDKGKRWCKEWQRIGATHPAMRCDGERPTALDFAKMDAANWHHKCVDAMFMRGCGTKSCRCKRGRTAENNVVAKQQRPVCVRTVSKTQNFTIVFENFQYQYFTTAGGWGMFQIYPSNENASVP